MFADFRFAARSLIADPGFLAIVVTTLAVGIGLNAAIFSALYGVVLRPLPYAQPDQVMTLWETSPEQGIAQERVSGGNFMDWREQAESFDDMAAFRRGSHVLTDGDIPVQVGSATVSPAAFSMLGVDALHGRVFASNEEAEEFDHLVVLSHGLWERHFGADAGIVDTVIQLSDESYTVVGVMPAGFHFPPGEKEVEVWTPLAVSPVMQRVRGMRFYDVVGRLADGVSEQQAHSELDAITQQINVDNPESNRGWSVDLVPARDQLVGPVASTLWLLWGAAGIVLIIACVNVAGLLLARSGENQPEYAIRAALGAGRGALVRRSVAESLLLAGLGGVAGILVGFAGAGLLRRFMPRDIPRVDEIAVDPTVILIAVGLSLAAGLLFGLVPAVRAMTPRLGLVLQEGGRGHHGGGATARTLDALVVLEIALAIVLLVGAGLLIRSFGKLTAVDPGFRTDGVVAVAITLPEPKYEDSGPRRIFYNGLVEAVEALPGVTAAGATSALPMSPVGLDFDLPFQILGRPPAEQNDRPRAEYRSVTAGYLESLGVPLIRGRLLDDFDREEGRPVMLINETMERLYFEGEEALGQALEVPMAGNIEIVGVVGDVRHNGLADVVRPEMFVAYEQFSLSQMEVVAHTTRDPADVIDAIRRTATELDPVLPLGRAATLDQLIDESLAQPRFNMVLLSALGLCALVLAAVGIYGIVSYGVVRRTPEIGIRKAFGAEDSTARSLLVNRALRLASIGVVAGMAGAAAGASWIRSLLFGIEALDPMTLVAVTFVLFLVALGAAAIPANRAARIDPAIALRRR
ncbi:MAG: FtsX-like permease family protein [Acidobacteria bacterium]|nr:FtsX-like permease family protein [Acidobacteriota bacterium]